MSLLRKGIFFLLIFLLMIPVLGVAAQDDPPEVPIDDEFVETLVMVMTSKDFLQGNEKMENLNGLRDYIYDYYKNKINIVNDQILTQDSGVTLTDVKTLEDRGDALLNKIDAKIGNPFEWYLKLLIILTESDEMDKMNHNPIVNIVSGGEDDYDIYFNSMENDDRYSAFMTNGEAQINAFLGIDTVSAMPSIAPIIKGDVASVNDSSAVLKSIGKGNDDKAVGINSTAPIDLVPSTVKNNDGIDSPLLNSSSNVITDKQVVQFKNNGFETVMVKVESYVPVDGLRGGLPGGSTVVANGSNSSASLELPLGTYTFCYEWELGSDLNGDGKTDYHHRSSGAYTIDSKSNSVVVTLNPDSVVSNPNGRCGENLNSVSPTTANQFYLTPEEKANAGVFIYTDQCSGVIFGISCDGDPSDTVNLNFEFDENGVKMADVSGDADTLYLTKIGVNQYFVNVEGADFTITFTGTGFNYYVYSAEAEVDATLYNTRQ